ncbi:MAG: universal stress protein, partial [Deltaproteobacteria bacterium]|nr:universal stress protein [Deltaproteobacteria bacterium]
MKEEDMIPKIKRVLYATDLSENSMYAFRYAVNTAEKHDAEMIVLHVIEEIPAAVRAYTTLERDIAGLKQGTIEAMSTRLDE